MRLQRGPHMRRIEQVAQPADMRHVLADQLIDQAARAKLVVGLAEIRSPPCPPAGSAPCRRRCAAGRTVLVVLAIEQVGIGPARARAQRDRGRLRQIRSRPGSAPFPRRPAAPPGTSLPSAGWGRNTPHPSCCAGSPPSHHPCRHPSRRRSSRTPARHVLSATARAACSSSPDSCHSR